MGRIALTLAWTAALMAAALPAWAEESAPRRNQPEQGNSYSLATIMDKPDLFLDQEVLFYCRFATISDLYKPVNTAFSPVRHVNFAVWPDKAAVWDAGERRTILPTFYIAKEDSALLGTLAGVRKYDLIAVAGLVQSTYGGHPWILVKGLERMDNPEQLLTATVVELMENGCAALAAKNGVYAADCFEQALEQGLPAAFRATGHEKLARAYLLQEKFAAAKDNLRLAVEAEPADPYLHLALAELSVQVNEPDQALAHCRLALAGVAAQPRAYGIQAEAYSQQGKHAAALEALETAANAPGLDERDQAMLIVRRARILAHADRLAEAADAYAQAAAPGSPYANASWLYDEIGLFHHTAYFAGNDTAELHAAPRAYETAAQTADATADHLYRFAEISFQLEQLGLNDDDAASAETIVKQALVEQPEHPASQMLLARILHAHGKSGEAEKLYQKTAPALADDGQALLALSMAYRDLGDKARAAKAAKLAVQTEPWNKRVAALSPLMVEAGDAAAASAIAAAAQPSSRREGSVVPAAVRTGMEKPQPTTPLVSLSETVLIPTWDVAEAIPGVYLEEIRTTNADAFVAAAVIPDSNVAISPPPQDKTVKTESGGRLVRIRPGEAIRIDSSGAVRTELMDAQGIRASVGPKVSDNAGRKSQSQQSKWPRAEVRIPYQPLPKAKTGPGVAGSKNTISAAHPAKPVLASETALAAPSAWRKEKTEAIDEESPLPPSFSFSSDSAPVLSGVNHKSRSGARAAMPTRNPNVYRRYSGRRPAEIFVADDPDPLPREEESSMTPPADGAIHRTEVRLPGSSIGIGQASDYH